MQIVWASACVFSHTKAARWTARDVRKIFSVKPEGRWTCKEAPMCFCASPQVQCIHPTHTVSLLFTEIPSFDHGESSGLAVLLPVGSTPASTSATARKCSWGALCCVRAGSSLGVPTSTLPSSKALGRGVTLWHSHQLLQHTKWLCINSFCSTKIHLHELASFLTVVNGFHYSFFSFLLYIPRSMRKAWEQLQPAVSFPTGTLTAASEAPVTVPWWWRAS